MVKYHSISNATLATVLTELADRGVGPGQIIQIYHDGTNHVAVFTTQ